MSYWGQKEGFGIPEYNQQYIAGMRPMFIKKALFAGTCGGYMTPEEPSAYDLVTIWFRTAKNNVDSVYLVSRGEKHHMLKSRSDEDFDYYSVELQMENTKCTYYFEIRAGRLVGYYDIRGLVEDVNEHYHFAVIPGLKVPQWAKGAVMYQIYVDRFYNGDPSNDVLTDEYRYINAPVHKVEDWSRYPVAMDVREFYGGDLQGVMDKLDYLQDLGVEVIYFNPLFVSPSNHKYDIQDYDYIDPHIGKIIVDEGELLAPDQLENKDATRYISRVTNKVNLEASNQLFIQLVEEAHKRGIRVILDGVFNHCGSFNKWMDRERIYENAPGYEKGAYVSEQSPYRDYFDFRPYSHWPYNGAYNGWWNHDTLPKLNYEASRELTDYILEVARKWVSPPYNADGWRLDVAADLGHSPQFNHEFWQRFRRAVKDANPEAIILAEHYGSTKDWLQGNEWDSVMNYDAFMEPVTWFLTGMEKHSDDFRWDLLGNAESFWGAMRHHSASFTMPSWFVAMNELSNHDHSRFLTRTNRRVGRTATLGPEAANQGINKAVFREAVVMQMTWVGAPTIYYGDEAGLCGFTDPDSRRTYPWGKEDRELIAFHKDIIRMRKANPVLRTGALKYVDGAQNFLAYARMSMDEVCLICVNNSEEEITREVSVWEAGTPRKGKLIMLFQTDAEGYWMRPLPKEPVAGAVGEESNDSGTEDASIIDREEMLNAADGRVHEYEICNGQISIKLPKTSAVVLKYMPD